MQAEVPGLLAQRPHLLQQAHAVPGLAGRDEVQGAEVEDQPCPHGLGGAEQPRDRQPVPVRHHAPRAQGREHPGRAVGRADHQGQQHPRQPAGRRDRRLQHPQDVRPGCAVHDRDEEQRVRRRARPAAEGRQARAPARPAGHQRLDQLGQQAAARRPPVQLLGPP